MLARGSNWWQAAQGGARVLERAAGLLAQVRETEPRRRPWARQHALVTWHSPCNRGDASEYSVGCHESVVERPRWSSQFHRNSDDSPPSHATPKPRLRQCLRHRKHPFGWVLSNQGGRLIEASAATRIPTAHRHLAAARRPARGGSSVAAAFPQSRCPWCLTSVGRLPAASV